MKHYQHNIMSFEEKLYHDQIAYWSSQELDKKFWNSTKLTARSKWLVEELKKIEFQSLYEVGMGCGRNLFYINSSFPNVEIGGNDINLNMLSFAKNILPDSCLIECVDAIDINTEHKFDVILTHGLLMHLPSKYANIVVNNCLDKTSKYVIHLEKEGPEYFYKGPKELDPAIVSSELTWAPDIEAMYKIRKDCNIVTSRDIEIENGGMVKLVVIEKKIFV